MAPSKPPGVQGSDRNATSVMDGTLCKQESPKPGIIGSIFAGIKGGVTAGFHDVEAYIFSNKALAIGVSFELSDAVDLPDVPTTCSGLTRAEKAVLAWLRKYKVPMMAAEMKFKIDRRAIAGAIAWEALENVQPSSIRAVGPGKVHIQTAIIGGSDETVAKEVEELGYLKQESDDDRKKLLQTAQGAIEYIGAIMGAIADKAANYDYQIRCNPPILTTVYQAWDIPEWENRLRQKNGQPLEPAAMGAWVRDYMDYLTDAVNKPALSCASGEAELRRQGWKVNFRTGRNTNVGFA